MARRAAARLVLRTCLLVAAATPAVATAAAEAEAFELLGETSVARRLPGSAAPVGGLSGLAFDPGAGTYWAVSDDRSQFAPARLYELAIDIDTEAARLGGVEVLQSVELRRVDGSTFPQETIDPESLAPTASGGWVVASEGHAETGVEPALFEFRRDGTWRGEFALPRRYRPRRRAGVRHNLALESAAISPAGRWLFSGTENALIQDGEKASSSAGSPSRLLRIDLATRRLAASYVYWTEPLAAPPAGADFAVNGLVDLIALDGERLLALERSFTRGAGNVVRLFLVDLARATDVSRRTRLRPWRRPRAVTKHLLLDLATLGVKPDNLEGMTLGPELADGRGTLILLADDNFNPRAQRTQLLVLAFADELLASIRDEDD